MNVMSAPSAGACKPYYNDKQTLECIGWATKTDYPSRRASLREEYIAYGEGHPIEDTDNVTVRRSV